MRAPESAFASQAEKYVISAAGRDIGKSLGVLLALETLEGIAEQIIDRKTAGEPIFWAAHRAIQQ